MGHRVIVWKEYRHERDNDVVAEVYPNGIRTVIADALATVGHDVDTATLDEDSQHALTDDLLEKTDVLTWWGHAAHDEVNDEVVERRLIQSTRKRSNRSSSIMSSGPCRTRTAPGSTAGTTTLLKI